MERKAYPSDISDDEWAFVAPYLTLMAEEAPQRVHSLREVFNGLRWLVRTGAPWRMMPNDLPPGRMSINRRSAGGTLASSRPSCTICVSS
jgi:transposase